MPPTGIERRQVLAHYRRDPRPTSNRSAADGCSLLTQSISPARYPPGDSAQEAAAPLSGRLYAEDSCGNMCPVGFTLLGELGGKNVHLLDRRRPRQEIGSLRHQRRSYPP